MRVLIVASVAAVVALMSWPACYDPDVKDCQFTCGADDTCPGDTSCLGGFCRTDGSGSACPVASGSDPCPVVQAGCEIVDDGAGSATSATGGKFCIEDCSGGAPLSFGSATDACAGGWHLAVFDTPEKLATAKALPGTDWIGLSRKSISPTAAWNWLAGKGTVSGSDPNWSALPHGGGTYTCAALAAGKYYSDACETPHTFACSN